MFHARFFTQQPIYLSLFTFIVGNPLRKTPAEIQPFELSSNLYR